MKLVSYIKDKVISIVIYLLMVVLISLILKVFNLDKSVLIVIFLILIINGVMLILVNYFRKRSYYNNILGMLDKLDKKYLVLETVLEPITYEEKIVNNILYDINKSMIENINIQKRSINEFKDYIEMWIHEVKLPIASMVLKCHNHKEVNSNELLSIIRRLDNDIDQILYYMRSEITEKDFIISEVSLKDIVRSVSLKNKDDLLENKIELEVNIDNECVYTDKKWMEFILNQIISNSIKYKKEKDSFIKITSNVSEDKVNLIVYDNGIGISKGDIKRVFDKSFTGKNGRDKIKSTGMGLYIVKNLCSKLGHNIYIESVLDEYTKVIIEFGKNNYYNF
mgnify:FL=1